MSTKNVAAQLESERNGPRSPASWSTLTKSRADLFRSLVVIGSVLLGVALGIGVLVFSKWLPSDLSRTEVLLRTLHTRGCNPRAVVFGDSVIMSGVDTHIVRARTHASGPVLNLSSVGQTLAESALYYQELPSSVTTIVQALRIENLIASGEAHAFNLHVAYTFKRDGYRPDDETRRMLTNIFGETEMRQLMSGRLAAVIESRWLVRQYIDVSVKPMLRSDLNMRRQMEDLYYPQAFIHPMEQGAVFNELNDQAARACGDCFHPELVTLMISLQTSSVKKGRRYLVLLSPVHPALQEKYSAVYSRLKRDIQAGLFGGPENVIDAFQLLGPQDFLDYAHPTRAGAEKLSNLIAERLGQLH